MTRQVLALFVLISATLSPALAMPADTEKFLHDFYAAYSARDAAKLSAFYTNNAAFVDPSFELDLKGADQIRQLFTKVLPKYESLSFDISYHERVDEGLAVQGVMIGKIGAKDVRVPFVSFFHFNGDKISDERDLFDVLHFLIQLGAVPSPFAPKTSPAGTPSR